MLSPLFNNLLAPESDPTGGGVESDSEKDTLELLSEEELDKEPPLELDEKKPKKEPKEGEEDEEEVVEKEIDELEELEEELKGPKEEDLELTTPVRRKEILAKYPQLFKDFPYLEKAYYREQQFTEVFPTIGDARTASEKARLMDVAEQRIMSGDISHMLQAAKQEDNEAFLKIADNYLPTLRRVDQQAYYHVLGNVIKDTIITMVREGRALGEQGSPLQQAANILNQFVFGSQTFQPPTTLARKQDPAEAQREEQYRTQQEQQFMGQFESIREDLQTRADNVLKSTIDQHIDPKNTMTDYVKTHATREAFDTLETMISKDKQFRGLLDRLWEKAFEKRFDKESTEKIKSAYLSKAKTLLPSVIKRARNDALKGLGKRVSEDVVEEEVNAESQRRGPIQNGRPQAPSSGKYKSAKDIPRGVTTLDYLMKD